MKRLALVLMLSLVASASFADTYRYNFKCQSDENGKLFEAVWRFDREDRPYSLSKVSYKRGDEVFVALPGQRLRFASATRMSFILGTDFAFRITTNNSDLIEEIGKTATCEQVWE